ncbi:MAG: hypothetical protein EAZ97_07195 [Bacteroidetes bacterium]|nr:MAG: hypothetical protein EAZ97_07195 [Bacteroidota bacterium]
MGGVKENTTSVCKVQTQVAADVILLICSSFYNFYKILITYFHKGRKRNKKTIKPMLIFQISIDLAIFSKFF